MSWLDKSQGRVQIAEKILSIMYFDYLESKSIVEI